MKHAIWLGLAVVLGVIVAAIVLGMIPKQAGA